MILDIINIDADIRMKLSNKNSNLSELNKRVSQLTSILLEITTDDVQRINRVNLEINRLNELISNETEDVQLNFYISDSIDIIDQYKKFLKNPVKVSFMGVRKEPNKDMKNKLINDYMKIAKNYSNIAYDAYELEQKCCNCNEPLKFDVVDDCSCVCSNCSSEQGVTTLLSSFADTERVNISSKYSYDRKNHFRECINQYHGKQNVTIPKKVYTDLDKEFILHDLITKDDTSNRINKYKKVTKRNVMLFLTELGYTKQYENLNLIYSNITGRKLDDISYIYEPILADFDKLSDLYDKKYSHVSNSKSFINTQYVLFELLKRNNHKCRKEDFTELKTIERKFLCEEILETLFQELGWNYVSIF